jgi:hypothetical protein
MNDHDDLERLLLGRSARFRALLNRARQSIKDGKGLSEDAFWKAVRQPLQKKTKSPRKRRTGD